MKHPAHRSYKPSGVAWLGDVPDHWSLKRMKFVAKTIMGQSPNSGAYTFDESGKPFLQGNAEFGARHPVARYFCDAAMKEAPEGALLISVRAPVGALNIANRSYGIGRGLCAVVADHSSLLPSFAWHALTITRHELWNIATGSTYEAVSADEVAAMTMPLPPLNEQVAIATFLDHETARIDALIDKKQRQIELLQEKRAALISHAVTKGLDSKVKMKDSGVAWLGEIPDHWEAKRIKHALVIRGGQVDPRVMEYAEMMLIAPNHIESKTGRVIGRESAEDQGAISGKYLFRKGDVLYSKIRPELVKACIAPEDGLCSADMYAMVPRPGNVSKFLLYLLLSDAYTKLAVDESMRVAMPKINREDLGEIRWPFPPETEQEEIVTAIERQTGPIDALVAKVQSSIETLREYRTALISAAVTGKIDVRREVA